ncbi:hypothetical protein PILCRDRAFT_91752 [Piloderma croceum F 1598]|uniref:Uncharacterized protein n=1 Tax=Piloderma croceum (strain F 1598) TaxID=765440 RepID=A0A0C3BFN6_PILCF|nr:hypothetical protein PILCRDRAFT_91752 [Piloderma croceum F 1598]
MAADGIEPKCSNNRRALLASEKPFKNAFGSPYTTDVHVIDNSQDGILDKPLASMEEKGLRVLIFNQINRILDILEGYCIFQHYSEVCPIIVFSPAFNLSMGSYPIIQNTAVLMRPYEKLKVTMILMRSSKLSGKWRETLLITNHGIDNVKDEELALPTPPSATGAPAKKSHKQKKVSQELASVSKPEIYHPDEHAQIYSASLFHPTRLINGYIGALTNWRDILQALRVRLQIRQLSELDKYDEIMKVKLSGLLQLAKRSCFFKAQVIIIAGQTIIPAYATASGCSLFLNLNNRSTQIRSSNTST